MGEGKGRVGVSRSSREHNLAPDLRKIPRLARRGGGVIHAPHLHSSAPRDYRMARQLRGEFEGSVEGKPLATDSPFTFYSFEHSLKSCSSGGLGSVRHNFASRPSDLNRLENCSIRGQGVSNLVPGRFRGERPFSRRKITGEGRESNHWHAVA